MYIAFIIFLVVGDVLGFTTTVCDDTCSYEDSCRQVLSQIKCLGRKIDELTKEIQNITNSIQVGGTNGCTHDPSMFGCPKKLITISHPKHIHITKDGKVYISGSGDGYVHMFDKNGNFQKKFAVLNGTPIGLYVKDDQLYVAGFKGGKIYEYTTNGSFIGVKISQKDPVGIAIDSDGKFYVSEWDTGKIHVYNSDGTKSHVISGVGNYSRKIQFDSNGNLRITDFYTGKVFVVTKSGDHLCNLKIEGVGYAEGLFVDLDCEDNMYVADRSSPGEVYICDKNGKQIKVMTGFEGAGDAAIAPDGTLWITDFVGNKVYLY